VNCSGGLSLEVSGLLATNLVELVGPWVTGAFLMLD
jgi:hypothetical protein